MSPSLAATLVLGAYLLGSVSFSVVVVKLMQGLDVRTVGSGNAGATNVLRAAGKKAGAAVLALDVIKGVTAVAVPRALDAPLAVVSGAAVAVVVGHVFPVFFGFRGGKGVATAAGALGTLAPAAMALGLVVFLAVVAWQRYVSLGSIVTAASFPLLVWISLRFRGSQSGAPWLLLASGAIAILIVTKHSRNLQRLRKGTEPRLGGGGRGR
jgi:acyl phosphate:glycerol-3-phosphate acyltransferase